MPTQYNTMFWKFKNGEITLEQWLQYSGRVLHTLIYSRAAAQGANAK